MATRLKRYFIILIVLLSACLCFLIALLAVSIVLNVDGQGLQNEVQYLAVCISDESEHSNNAEDVDSILLSGGVIITTPDNEYLAHLSTEGPEDYLITLMNYIGAFGWNLIAMRDDALYFSRSV